KPGPDPGLGPKGPRWPGELSGTKPPPLVAEKPGEHRPSMMQLEEFKKKITKEMLAEAKISPEEWQKFLKDYEALAKRADARASRDEKVPGSLRGGNLPTIGGRQIPAAKGRPDDLKSTGRGKAPPGYRDAYADFLRRLNTPAD